MRLFTILTIATVVLSACSKKVIKSNEFGDPPELSVMEKIIEDKVEPVKVDIIPEKVDKKPLYINSSVLFDFDSDRIRTDAMETLDGVILEIEKYPYCLILLTGNACRIGSDEYNYALGERRAESVKKYIMLQLQHIRESQIRIVSNGEGHCAVDKSRFSACRNVQMVVSE